MWEEKENGTIFQTSMLLKCSPIRKTADNEHFKSAV